jgi:hypothetical protein
MSELGIVTCMPCSGDIHPLAAKSYFAEATRTLFDRGVKVYRLDPSPSSNLAWGFNRGLCYALNMRLEGKATHFAMLHADISTSPWWLDTLWDEMERTGAHMISAASPIKDCHGVTSTAIGKDNCWNPWTRITMHELYELPETFGIEDLGENSKELGFNLLLNTGCMLIDLRPDYWGEVGDGGELPFAFEIRNRITFVPGRGYEPQTESEDWLISRLLSDAGAKLACTRKVIVNHHGTAVYSSSRPWGDWLQDQVGGRAAERAAEQRQKNSDLNTTE